MTDIFYVAHTKHENMLIKSHYCYKDYFGKVFLGESPYCIVEVDFDTLYCCINNSTRKVKLDDIYLVINYLGGDNNDTNTIF